MHHECVILADSPDALIDLCGISLIERVLRTIQRCGITRATVLSSTPDIIAQHLAQPSEHRGALSLTILVRPAGPVLVKQIVDVWPNAAQVLFILPGEAVFDSRLLRLLFTKSATATIVDSAVTPRLLPLVALAPQTIRGRLCGPALLQYDWAIAQRGSLVEALTNGLEQHKVVALDNAAQPLYSAAMRRELRPFWFPAPSPAQKKLAQHLILDSAQKGTLDFPAYIHAPIETFIVTHLCETSITPNQLTILCNIVAWGATALFATGQLVWGTLLALIVGILDGLDGKLARVKVETSKVGKLEHWLDFLFEWSWWSALAYYFRSSGLLPNALSYLFLLLLAEILDGLAKGSVLFFYGRLIDELGRFDRIVRFIGGRRNIYVWILAVGIISGTPAKAFVVMAWWEAVTAAVHIPRAAWALLLRWYRSARSKIIVDQD